MYQPGDRIIYSGEGVCRVESVGPSALSGGKDDRLYYTLKPLYRDGTIQIPADTKVFMRPIITQQEAEELIRGIPDMEPQIYENRNLRLLNEHYQQMIQTHTCRDLFQLIRDVYAKRRQSQAQGKKPGQVDERYMKRAEDILYGELAVVLDIPKDQVCEYITRALEQSD